MGPFANICADQTAVASIYKAFSRQVASLSTIANQLVPTTSRVHREPVGQLFPPPFPRPARLQATQCLPDHQTATDRASCPSCRLQDQRADCGGQIGSGEPLKPDGSTILVLSGPRENRVTETLDG
jgi:hypothetical protein